MINHRIRPIWIYLQQWDTTGLFEVAYSQTNSVHLQQIESHWWFHGNSSSLVDRHSESIPNPGGVTKYENQDCYFWRLQHVKGSWVTSRSRRSPPREDLLHLRPAPWCWAHPFCTFAISRMCPLMSLITVLSRPVLKQMKKPDHWFYHASSLSCEKLLFGPIVTWARPHMCIYIYNCILWSSDMGTLWQAFRCGGRDMFSHSTCH